MLLAIDKKNIEYLVPEYGDVFEYDESIESYFHILNANPNVQDNNDASLVVKGRVCTTDFLLMGDASSEVESKLVATYDTVEAQILKAGHHGSSTSSSLNFLRAVKPEVVVLSYGKDNSYGHPHQ